MKKKVLISFIILFCIMVMPMGVEAKKKSLGTCDYRINVNQLGLGTFSELSLKVTVYDDGSTGNRIISGHDANGEKFIYKPSNGLLLGNTGVSLQYSKMFDKNGDFYKAYQEKNNCPTLQFIYFVPNQLHFNVNTTRDPQGNPSISVDTESIGGNSDKKPSKKKTYCDSVNIAVRNSDLTAIFTTTETNGVREFTIKMDRDSSTAKYNEVATITKGATTYTFSVNPDDYDVYWSDQCSSAKYYLRAPGGAVETGERIIQTTEPSPDQNGSYNPDDVEEQKEWEQLGEDISSSRFDDPNVGCDDIIKMDEGSLGWLLNTILNYIKIIGPILVVLLSAIDFIKAVVGFDEKAMKEAQSKLVIRLVAAICLFLVPTLVQLLLSFINATTCTLG